MDNNEEKPIDFIQDKDILGQSKNKQDFSENPPSKMDLLDLKDFEFANNWDRFIAGIIDILILSVVFDFINNYLLFHEQTFKEMTGNRTAMFSNILVACLYHGFFDSSKWQGTFGKRIMRIKIIHESGNQMSFLRSIGRYLGSSISILIFLLGYITIFRDKHRQAWHDMMVGTYVMKEKKDNSEYQFDKKLFSKKRILGYGLIVLLLIIQVVNFVNLYNQSLDSALQEIKVKERQTLRTQIEAEIQSSDVSKSDFIYTDTINKFHIIVKKGFNCITTIPNINLLATNGDTSSSTLPLTSYMVMRGEAKKEPTPGQFLIKLQNSNPKYEFSNIKLTKYKNGYTIEEGKVIVHSDNLTFGTFRYYLKDKIFYQVMVGYDTEEKSIHGAKLTEEIFNSFDILE